MDNEERRRRERAYRKKYYEENKAECLRRCREWKLRNPDCVKEYVQKWKAANYERVLAYNREWSRKRALQRQRKTESRATGVLLPE